MTTVLKAGSPVYGGMVLSRGEGVVFVKGAIEGEVVEVEITERKRDYSLARVREIVEPSSFRVEPRCPYFGSCGGCQLQFVSYGKQLAMKEEILLDCLRRIGGLEFPLSPPVYGEPFGYRRRGQFKVSRDGKAGFYAEGTRDVVDIRRCALMSTEINEIWGRVREQDLSGIKEVHITHGDSLIALVKGRGFDEDVASAFIGAGFSGVAFDDGSYRGEGFVTLDLIGLSYTVSPWGFFQSNWALNTEVAAMVRDELGGVGGKRVLDLYAGAGNFSLPLAREAAEVVAVEENPHAVRDGQRNMSRNGVGKYRFSKAETGKARIDSGFDIFIVDPPRPGLDSNTAGKISATPAGRLVYISCNPATLARDLKKLGHKYELESIRMVDFFPNTYHIEAVAFLLRKGAP